MNQPDFETILRSRGVKGDALLDVLEIIDAIEEVHCKVDGQAMVLLFHATSTEKAIAIVKEQKMFGEEDGLFFSTKPNGQIVGYGNSIVTVQIPVEKLLLDDDFGDELHFRVEVKPHQKVPFDTSHYQAKEGRS